MLRHNAQLPIFIYLTAKYSTPVWCCSAHTCLVNNALNDALQTVTGCLSPIPKYLPVLSGIQLAELFLQGATISLANRGFLDPNHILRGQLRRTQNVSKKRRKSKCPFVSAAWKFLDCLFEMGIRVAQSTNTKWNMNNCIL